MICFGSASCKILGILVLMLAWLLLLLLLWWKGTDSISTHGDCECLGLQCSVAVA